MGAPKHLVRRPRARTHGVGRAALLVAGLAALLPVGAVGRASSADAAPAAPARLLQSNPDQVPDLTSLAWTEVFRDDFGDGPQDPPNDTTIDGSVWHVDEVNMFGVARAGAVDQTGGNLVLRTYTQGTDHITGRVLSGDNRAPFPNGFSATYGYVEADVKLDTKPGVRNAFWLMSPGIGNSPFGDPAGAGLEVDIFEHVNTSGAANNLLVGKHWDGVEEAHKNDVGEYANPTATPILGNWHKYGLLWDPYGYTVFVDGIKVGYQSTQALSNQPLHLRFTSEVVGGYAGAIPASYGAKGALTNNVMSVRYVRVMQRTVSDIPNHMTTTNRPLSVPFTVADYRRQDPGATDTESVVATASADNPTLFPSGSVAVAGNGPTDPDGGLVKGDFEGNPEPEWDLDGAANPTTANPKFGSGALALSEGGGRATQAVSGLRPSTTYTVDAWYDLQIEWTDTNGNGKVDTGEGDANAKFDWGVLDVDADRAGDQKVFESVERLSWQPGPGQPSADGWRHQILTFTTGPSTTSVTLFVANDEYDTTAYDSNVRIDGLTITPMVPPERTIVVTPASGQTGTSTITVIVSRQSRTGTSSVIGLEQFVVNVAPGGPINLDFETPGTAPTWWATSGFTQLVTDPFERDQSLRLSRPSPATNGAATQTINGLEPNTYYRLTATGGGRGSAGPFTLKASSYDGTTATQTATVNAPGWSGSVNFRTGATHTSVVAGVEDTNPADGYSLVRGVQLVKCTSTGCPTASAAPGPTTPALSTVGAQSIASGGRLTLGWSGSTPTGITSSNPDLIPTRNLATAASGTQSTLVARPLPDRTGEATITVSTSSGSTAIPVTVTDARLANPGFELLATGWVPLPSGATLHTADKRSGGVAMRLADGAGQLVQVISGLDYDTTYALGGWVKGALRFEVQDSTGNLLPGTVSTPVGTAGSYAKGQVVFTTGPDPSPEGPVSPAERASVRFVVKDDTPASTASILDDTFLFHGPTISPVREWSTRQGYGFGPTTDWRVEANFAVGRIPANGFFDPAVTSVTIPVADSGKLQFRHLVPNPARPGYWRLVFSTPAGGGTGTVNVTVRLTDPATGISYQRVLPVDVNAGSSFDNGRFQRGLGEWERYDTDGVPTDIDTDVVAKRPYTAPPYDLDKVLWVGDSSVRYQVTGLQGSTTYTVRGSVIGTTSKLGAWKTLLGPLQGEIGGTSSTWVDRSFTFTTDAGQTSAYIAVADDDAGCASNCDPAPAANPCVTVVAGTSCWDDIAVFKA